MAVSKDSRLLETMRSPRWRLARVPVGVILLIAGIFGFLPVVGFWMIPLGLSILAIDFPGAQKALNWLQNKSRKMVDRFRRK